MPYLVTTRCTLFGACVASCEMNAVTEGETQAYIDVHACTECGICARNCPSQAIVFIKEADEKGTV
jgi:ferredoxin